MVSRRRALRLLRFGTLSACTRAVTSSLASRLLPIFLSVLLAACRPLPDSPARAAVPLNPVDGILQAFRTHDIVALGDGAHGNMQSHAVRLALVRDDRIAEVVDDIVVEFGSARYQSLVDRFVSGEDVPNTTLRQVWENTTQAHEVWDVPIFEEFFRAVRDANAARPGQRQIRVLLGDPPIDWSRISTLEDLRAQQESPEADRDAHAVAVIQRDVIAKGHRALVIYGNMHFVRHDRFGEPGAPIVARLEQAGVKRLFTIWTDTDGAGIQALQPDLGTWPVPSMTVLRGSVLGAADFSVYNSSISFVNGTVVRAKPGLRMEEQFDALLYLGPSSNLTFSELPRSRCDDRDYMRMRLGRMALLPRFPDGGDPSQFLRDYCDRRIAQ